ncbi:hypothetical protein NCCNTM_13300 [Mycolicibacterium sp. NCC-Tsukiji]|nr:hypothetical protein NCCNTM_13300 [Mycolicibacterium sp. NCC-Tsukiji]
MISASRRTVRRTVTAVRVGASREEEGIAVLLSGGCEQRVYVHRQKMGGQNAEGRRQKINNNNTARRSSAAWACAVLRRGSRRLPYGTHAEKPRPNSSQQILFNHAAR